jgi:integrase/recombinase XerD
MLCYDKFDKKEIEYSLFLHRIPTFLRVEDITVNFLYETIESEELFYLAMWFFGFFANGINPKDIIKLRYSNFQGDFIIIQRQKTRRTSRRKPKKITIPVNEPMRRIIRRFGNPDAASKNYVFNILKPGLSPHRQRELNQNFTCTIIDWMNKIVPKVGIWM